MATRADQRKFHYIYKITRNDGSGKYYIGMHSTDDLEDGYFGSGKLLWHSINRHGKEIHSKEILEYQPSRKELKTREKEIVNEEILDDPKCMNLKLGGEGGWDHIIPDAAALRARGALGGAKSGKIAIIRATAAITPDTKRKALRTRELNGNPFTTKGLTFSIETRQKMSKAGSGEGNSQFGTRWVNKDGKVIKIKFEHLGEYIANGYAQGRKPC